MIKTLVVCLLFASTLCLFSEDSAVVKLTESNFKSLVLESEELWLVEFYGKYLLIQPLGVDTVKVRPHKYKKQPRSYKE